MKNKLVLLLAFVILFVSGITGAIPGYASDAGGQGKVEGKITFYEESTGPTESSEPATTGKLPSTVNVGGKLPQTGEVIRNYTLIGLGILLLILLFVIYHRKKEKGEVKDEEQ